MLLSLDSQDTTISLRIVVSFFAAQSKKKIKLTKRVFVKSSENVILYNFSTQLFQIIAIEDWARVRL